jgi:hypothetical protein
MPTTLKWWTHTTFTFTSLKGLRSKTCFGLGAGVGSARNLYYANLAVDRRNIVNELALGGRDDYVGEANRVDCIRFLAASGDLNVIKNLFGRLMEVHVYTPGAALDTIKATSSELAIESSTTDAPVGTAIGHHVKSVAKKSTGVV